MIEGEGERMVQTLPRGEAWGGHKENGAAQPAGQTSVPDSWFGQLLQFY